MHGLGELQRKVTHDRVTLKKIEENQRSVESVLTDWLPTSFERVNPQGVPTPFCAGPTVRQ